jgi:hypothetical protein
MKKIKNICSIRNILCFLLVLLVYFVPLVFLKANKIHYESLKTLPIPFGVYKASFFLIGVFTALIVCLFKPHFKEKEDKLIRYGVRRFILYLILNFLFLIALIATFFQAQNLFLTYVLALSGLITSLFILMEAILIKKAKAWWTVPLLLWHLLLTVSSIFIFLYN